MKVSVITVCWNSGGTIAAAMESVLAQRGVEVEYIVVDGGSKDGTVERIKEYAEKFGGRMRWTSERDEGMYDAINKGIAMASGDIVGILNADDMLEGPETLRRIAEAFEQTKPGESLAGGIQAGAGEGESPRVEAVYADVRFVKADLATTVRYYSAKHWRPWMHNFGYMPPHPSVYIRREVFARLGGYKLGYQISADFELMVRYLCRNRVKARYLDESVVKMRLGGKSTKNWRANVLLNVENVRANRENGYWCCMAMMVPKYLFKVWGFVFRR